MINGQMCRVSMEESRGSRYLSCCEWSREATGNEKWELDLTDSESEKGRGDHLGGGQEGAKSPPGAKVSGWLLCPQPSSSFCQNLVSGQ